MKPPPFEYHAPRSLPEAAKLLAELPDAKLIAGGQSLMPMLNFRFIAPSHLIDLNGIGELSYIRKSTDTVAIGAMTRQRDLELSSIVAAQLPVMREAVGYIGHVQTRNRGTIGGSLCHLDPAAELPAIAMAYDAEVDTVSIRGVRTMTMADFPAGYMTPRITADEIVKEVRLTAWHGRHSCAFEEFARRRGDFAIVSVVVLLSAGPDNRITRVALTLAGIGVAPMRISNAERLLLGKLPTTAAFEEAAAVCSTAEASEDPYASAAYRKYLIRTLTLRALNRAAQRLTAAR
jgi:carbon-monoxide dehydrogenase medium subunit